jgi:cardiolipin synthase (CMP-forming)
MVQFKELYNFSNGLSVLRLLMAFPMYILVVNGQNYYAVALISLAVLTDIGDGYFARKLNQVTEMGKIIDPLADKVYVAGTFIALIITGDFPLWYAIVIIGRDLLIVTAGIILSKRIKTIPMSNYIGKAAVLMIGQSIIIALLKLDSIMEYSIALALFGVAMSLTSYTINLIKMLKNTNKES